MSNFSTLFFPVSVTLTNFKFDDNWNSVYTSVKANSANWNSTYTSTKNNSANWDSVYTSAKANSGSWDSTYTSTKNNSANWNSVYTSTNNNSAGWNNGSSAYTTTQANSANWNSVYTSTSNNSANWDSVYTSAKANSANWNSVYTTTNTNSAKYDSVYTTTNTNSANWNSVYTTTNTNSANWNSVYTTTNTNSAKYDSVYTTTNTNSANWNSVYTSTSNNSANWNSVYTTTNTNSANWILQNGNSFGVTMAIGTNDSQSISVKTNGAQRLLITNSDHRFNGNVAIGTTGAPSERLTVHGNISATGTITALGGNSDNWNSVYTTVKTISSIIPDPATTISPQIGVGTTALSSINFLNTSSAQLLYTVPAGKVFLVTDFSIIIDAVAGGSVSDPILPTFRLYRHDTLTNSTNQVTNSLTPVTAGNTITTNRYFRIGGSVAALNGKALVSGDDASPQNKIWFRVDSLGTNTYTALSGRVVVTGNLL